MNASTTIATVASLLIVLISAITLILSVRNATRKNLAKLQEDLAAKYQDGIREGERRMEPKIGRLAAQLELRTSERDQARETIGEYRSLHFRDRRGDD